MRDINNYTDKYVEEPFEATMAEIRRKTVIEQCQKYKHDNILEIGCGMMPFFMDFKDYKSMIIVEPSETFANNATMLSEAENKNIKIICGFFEDQIERVKEIKKNIDYIILSSVLHELDDPQKMLKAILELCGVSTVVHINVPNANSIHRLIAMEVGLISDVHQISEQMKRMQRRRTYDLSLLEDEITNAGFKVIDKGSYFVKPFTHNQMQQCIDMGIIDQKVLDGLEKLIKYMPEYGAGIYVNIRRG